MRNRLNGFSLLEMTIVVLTLGVLFAMAIPRYSASLNRYNADAAAQRIAIDLALAQSVAKTSTKGQTIIFNLAANTYQMNNVAASDSAAATYLVDLSAPPYQARLISVSFAGAAQATFDRYGMPGAAGTVVIQAGDVQKTIVLDANSGKATVQ